MTSKKWLLKVSGVAERETRREKSFSGDKGSVTNFTVSTTEGVTWVSLKICEDVYHISVKRQKSSDHIKGADRYSVYNKCFQQTGRRLKIS